MPFRPRVGAGGRGGTYFVDPYQSRLPTPAPGVGYEVGVFSDCRDTRTTRCALARNARQASGLITGWDQD